MALINFFIRCHCCRRRLRRRHGCCCFLLSTQQWLLHSDKRQQSHMCGYAIRDSSMVSSICCAYKSPFARYTALCLICHFVIMIFTRFFSFGSSHPSAVVTHYGDLLQFEIVISRCYCFCRFFFSSSVSLSTLSLHSHSYVYLLYINWELESQPTWKVGSFNRSVIRCWLNFQ